MATFDCSYQCAFAHLAPHAAHPGKVSHLLSILRMHELTTYSPCPFIYAKCKWLERHRFMYYTAGTPFLANMQAYPTVVEQKILQHNGYIHANSQYDQTQPRNSQTQPGRPMATQIYTAAHPAHSCGCLEMKRRGSSNTWKQNTKTGNRESAPRTSLDRARRVPVEACLRHP
jgi:hypothetical protein